MKKYFLDPVDCVPTGAATELTMYRCISCANAIPGNREALISKHTEIRQQAHIIQELKTKEVTGQFYLLWETLEVPPWGDRINVCCRACEEFAELRSYNVNLTQFLGHQSKTLTICKCFDLPTALLEIGYFPCSPITPRIAIAMEVLEEFHLLNVICHVSNYQYAVYLQRKHTNIDSIDLYRCIQRCYRPFSLLYQQTMIMAKSAYESARIDCEICIRCDQPTITMDACFGATSLLKTSKLDIEPHQQHDYLLKDLDKSEIVSKTEDVEREEEVDPNACQTLASKITNARTESEYFQGLHYTGITGSICKHGIPLWFLNISHGKEKTVFGAKLLQHIATLGQAGTWNVKYDIMCS